MKKTHYKYFTYGLGIFAFLLFLFISKKIRAALTVSVFIVLNMILSSYKKFIKIPVEIEFLTLGIVFTTLTYGVKAGLVIAILGGILSFIVGYNISPFSFPMLTGYIMMAILSYFLRFLDITSVGLIVTLMNNVLVFSLYNFVFKYDIVKNLSFSLSNIIFNVILFINVVPYLSSIT